MRKSQFTVILQLIMPLLEVITERIWIFLKFLQIIIFNRPTFLSEMLKNSFFLVIPCLESNRVKDLFSLFIAVTVILFSGFNGFNYLIVRRFN